MRATGTSDAVIRGMKNMTDEYQLRVRQIAIAQCRCASDEDRRANDARDKDERKAA